MAPEGAQLLASGLSTEVVETILQSRAPATWKQYALKWKLFTSWCGQRLQDPVNCPVGTVLEFLQERFSAGLSPSTLKVYVAAHRAALWRKADQLFVCFGPPKKGSPATKQTLSRWVVEAISLAYESSGLLSPMGVRAHSTRSMVASKAFILNEGLSFCRIFVLWQAGPLRTHLSASITWTWHLPHLLSTFTLATFYSKLNILNIYDFGFNKIFPGNLVSSTIPILSNSKALECDMLVIRTSEIGSRKF